MLLSHLLDNKHFYEPEAFYTFPYVFSKEYELHMLSEYGPLVSVVKISVVIYCVMIFYLGKGAILHMSLTE